MSMHLIHNYVQHILAHNSVECILAVNITKIPNCMLGHRGTPLLREK